MQSLQYAIDTICASFTEAGLYGLIRARLEQGPFTLDELVLLVQSKDRSLDPGSAGMLAETALENLEERGEARKKGTRFFAAG